MLQKLRIFYFSGTGNAKRIAHWFSAQATESMVECKLFNIAEFKDHTVTGIATDELIIIISATHGFNYPKITLDFIGRLPKANNSVVLMNTRAGMKIGRFITPGLSGIALMLSSVILRNKGYKIVGKVPFDMPSNWLSIHPALSANAIQYIHKANYERVKAIWLKIYQLQIVDTAKKDIVQDLLIAPVALAYYFAGRFILAKSFYASAGCDNCGACIQQCPAQAIKLIHNRPYWTFRCESCMHCMSICPKKAVNTAHGIMLFVSILSSTAMTTLFYKYVVYDTVSSFAHFLWFSGLYVLLLWVFYFLQHLFFKNKLFNKLISLLSLTHYKCWGRYKSIDDNK